MSAPYVSIDLGKVEHNARVVVELCKRHGIEVTGVTKGVCGHPDVASAMLRGGVNSIADSRIDNLRRLGAAGVDASLMMLSLPPLSGVDEVVVSADVSLNSELCVLEALSAAAAKRGMTHEVVIMVDLGDLREGLVPDELDSFVEKAKTLEHLRIIGIGTNLACFSGLAPSPESMRRLAILADEIEDRHGLSLRWVSGINSSGLELIAAGGVPARINHARIGEAILLGRETIRHSPWPDTYQDAFVLHAEVLELKQKPSFVPGERGEDAFGGRSEPEDRGSMHRALLNIGREDVLVEGLTPLVAELRILGGSSGYLVLDVTAAPASVRVGDELTFNMSYGALLATMTSDYVGKRVLEASTLRPET